MTKSGKYDKHIRLYVTDKMHQYIELMAKRENTSMNDIARQAIREYLDRQEDVIGSRSRMGRTVMQKLEIMQHRLLRQVTHQSKLQLAATIILLSEQGHDAKVVEQITKLAAQPGLDKVVKADK